MISPEFFKNDVMTLASDIGVNSKEVHIRKMKRKLASCSSRGRLTFDITLLNETKEVRYKAILHELLHLKYPNHGKMFNAVLNTYLQKSLSNKDINDHQTHRYNEGRHYGD